MTRIERLRRGLRAPDVSLGAAIHVWQRNASVYSKTLRYYILPNFFSPLLYLISMGLGVGSYVPEMNGQSYLAFLVPGLLASQAMMGASFEVTYDVFIKMHHVKTYQAITATPVSPADVALGEMLWGITQGTGYGVTFLIVATLAGVGPAPQGLLVLLALPFVAAAFSAIGLVFTALVEVVESINYYYELFLTPLFLLSGIFFPLEQLPSWARAVAAWTPLFHGVRACRGLLAARVDADVALSLGWLGSVSVIFLWIAMLLFERRLRR